MNQPRPLAHALVEGHTESVDQLIARVLRQARLAAKAHQDPDAARAILHVAHAFADELAAADSTFDRLRFIVAATETGVAVVGDGRGGGMVLAPALPGCSG
jgi:hypothetical protein